MTEQSLGAVIREQVIFPYIYSMGLAQFQGKGNYFASSWWLTLIVIFQGEQLEERLDGLGDRMAEVEDVRLPGLEAQGWPKHSTFWYIYDIKSSKLCFLDSTFFGKSKFNPLMIGDVKRFQVKQPERKWENEIMCLAKIKSIPAQNVHTLCPNSGRPLERWPNKPRDEPRSEQRAAGGHQGGLGQPFGGDGRHEERLRN